MPRVARFRIAAIGELYRQLRYAPAEARRRQMDAAERLVAGIDPGKVYPADFVVFRITGYRPGGEGGPVLVGEALLGDLAVFVQRLSHGLELDPQALRRRALGLQEVAARLRVSVKTLQRYRRRGLVCHYVLCADGVKRLACFEDALAAFTARHRDRVDRAARFNRVAAPLRRQILDEARRAHRDQGLSLNQTARRLADRFGRAPETLRSMLVQHDRTAGEPIFGEPGALGRREAALIHRAALRGVPAATLARRFGKAIPTVHRAVNRGRRELLLELDLPAAGDPDAEIAACALADVETEIDALELIAAQPGPADSAAARAYAALKRRAGCRAAALPVYPSGGALDAVETDLRHATLVKRCLVAEALPAAIRAVEQFLGGGLAAQPTEEILGLLRRAIRVTADAIEQHDPARGPAARAAGYAMDRVLARSAAPRPGRAATRHEPGSVRLSRPFEDLAPWQRWLSLRADLRGLVGRLDAEGAALMRLRYGLGGRRPVTLAELGAATGRTASAAARLVRRAEATLRELSASRTGTADARPAGRTSSARPGAGRA